MKKFNYENSEYLKKLDILNSSYYSKYIKFIQENITKKSIFLDVGCGNGVVLYSLKKIGFHGYGVDISKLFIRECKKKDLENVYWYDGINLPFENKKFDLIGSFNVLEHTENPELFLIKQIEKIKKGGKIIVACPNFHSVLFPNTHPRIKGIKNKMKNLALILKTLILGSKGFTKMKPIIRKPFQYDDDAIVETNLSDIKNVLISNGCEIVYESGFINLDTNVSKYLDSIPFLPNLFPSCFIIGKRIT